MDLSVPKKRIARVFGGLLALTICAGSMQATILSSSKTATVAISAPGVLCNTLTGPPVSPQSITVYAFPTPAVGTNITVGVVQIAGLKITPPSPAVLSSVTNAAGLVFTVNSVAGCAGLTTASAGVNTITPQFTTQTTVGAGAPGAVVNDVLPTVTATLTALTSPLVAAAVTVKCYYNSVGPVYIPGAPQTVSVTSAANLGTPFTVTRAGLPSWLVLNPATPGGTATTTSSNFTVQASAGCGAFVGTPASYALPLATVPAAATPATVTINLVASTISPLTVTPNSPPISMSFVKSSGVAAVQNVNVTTSVPGAYFTVNTATLPIWLTVNLTGAVVPPGGKAMTFSTTTATESLAPGTYTATVYLQTAGTADYPIPITLLVTNKPAKLLISSANPMAVTYTLGGATPVTAITVASTDSPIPYSIAFGGVLAPQLTGSEQSTGIAYSFGTTINVTYNPVLFETAVPGTVISGTMTFTWGSPASVSVVTINLTVASPGATLTSLSPGTLPTAAPGTVFNVTLTGSGFVCSSDPTQATRVGIVTGTPPGTLNLDTNITAPSTCNASNMIIKIVVPAAGTDTTNLPFAVGGPGGPVFLGVVNGNASSIPTGTQTLAIGNLPIIYGITSSSSFTEVSGGNLPSFAPYDMVSIFGTNFCSSLNTGCASTTLLAGAPDPVTFRFPFQLSPDALPGSGNDTRRQLSVTFYPHGTLTGGLPAPLLFATNGQINAIVPGAVTTTPSIYDVVVSFGCPALVSGVGCTPSTVASSIAAPVNTVPTDPGIFTVGSDGQGQPAALAAGTYALITSANPAGMRNGAPSDTIQVYVTGLGVPPGTAAFGSNNGACITPLGTGYLGAITAANPVALSGLATIDGFVLQSSLFTGDFPPCFASEPTATVGGVAATINYAAFVDDTVAGLYQVNMVLPSATNTFNPNFNPITLPAGSLVNVTGPTQLPVFINLGGVYSQAGVMLQVAPRLLMATAPAYDVVSTSTYNLSIGHAIAAGMTITGSNGGVSTGDTYTVTSGVLPKGITLTTAGGILTIGGTPAQNSSGNYPVTITATDASQQPPLTGSVSFSFYVPGGLFVTTGSVTNGTWATPSTIATVTAVGGTAPYNNYAITSTALAGMSVTAGGLLKTDGTTPAGTYIVTVTATDSAGITGTVNVTFTIKLLVTLSPVSPITYSISGGTPPITTVTVAGGSGTYSYTIDAASTANALNLSFTGNALNVGTATAAAGMSVIIDVIDTGAAPTGGVTTVSPGTQNTLTLTLGS